MKHVVAQLIEHLPRTWVQVPPEGGYFFLVLCYIALRVSRSDCTCKQIHLVVVVMRNSRVYIGPLFLLGRNTIMRLKTF